MEHFVSGIVFMNDIELKDLVKYFRYQKIEVEHERLWELLKQGKSILEKDNTFIEDLLKGFFKVNKFIKQVPELIEDICIGYCIIPISSDEIRGYK